MKVLCLIDSLGSGGAQRQLVGLARLLKEHSYEVKVVWYHENSFYRYYLEEHKIDYENVLLKNKWVKLRGIARVIKRFFPDVVIAYLDGPAVISCLLRLTGQRFRLIVSERNTTQTLNWKERIKFFFYRQADAIVPNSFSQTNFIQRYFPSLKNRLFTITNFVDTDYFSPAPFPHDPSYPLRILVVGRINPQKNVLHFLQTVRQLKDRGYKLKVDWYGKALDAGYHRKCLFLQETLGIKDYIEFHGENKDILNVYRQADAFCLPSLFEGFPNVVCEAMACGLPVLCSNVCDNGRIVKDGVNGFLFNPDSVEEITAALTRFVELPVTERQKISSINREVSLVRFSEKTFVQKYIEILS